MPSQVCLNVRVCCIFSLWSKLSCFSLSIEKNFKALLVELL